MKRRSSLVIAGALVGLTALLVGFQGASMLVTVTQLGASAPKPQPAKSHASLVPQPPVPVIKPAEQKTSEPAPTISAGEEPPPAEQPQQPAAQQQPTQVVADNQSGTAAAAKAKAQAEMDALGPQLEQDVAPRPEPRRRYRAPRPELHKVY